MTPLLRQFCADLETVVLRGKSTASVNTKPSQQKPLRKKSRRRGDLVRIFV